MYTLENNMQAKISVINVCPVDKRFKKIKVRKTTSFP